MEREEGMKQLSREPSLYEFRQDLINIMIPEFVIQFSSKALRYTRK